MSEKVKLSVVIPVYNSARIFPELYQRLVAALDKVVSSFEIVAVVDGCSDDSASVVSSFCERDPRVKLIEFARNFGHQAAVTAGLQYASGEMVVIMDDDLEDPPEVLPRFISKAQEGYDVVYGVRRRRKVSLLRRLSYRLFYRLINKLSDVDMPYDSGDFCLMGRPVVEVLNAMPESNRYIRGLRAWLGFSQIGLEYERGARFAGEPGYNLVKYLVLASDGILSFSYKPLSYVTVTGFIIALASFIVGVRSIIIRLAGRVADVPGWASLIVSILFVGGAQLVSIGIVGQYVARIYDEVKRRPKFVVKRLVGFGDKSAEEISSSRRR